MGIEPEWKVDKQPAWLVGAIKKTITELPGGYAEAAEWLGVTENALFNRLRTDGDQIFPLGWAMVLQRAGGSTYIADAIARHSNGVFVPLTERLDALNPGCTVTSSPAASAACACAAGMSAKS